MGSNATSVAEKKPRAPAEIAEQQNLPKIGEVFNPYGMFNGVYVPEPLLRCHDLSASAKLLYGRLTRFAGQDGRCFPSIETLATALGMDGRQVQRLIGQLCSTGFLRKEPQFRKNGSQTSNAYAFLYHSSLAPARAIQSKEPEAPQAETHRGDKNVTPGKKVRRGVTAMSPPEDSPLNLSSVNSSSNSAESTASTQAAAANPNLYPRSAARFREFYPRTTDSVIGRILRAVLASCPDGTDEDIEKAVYVARDQISPGLWAHTMPESVREIVRRRITQGESARGAEELAGRSRQPQIPLYQEDPSSTWAETKARLKERLTNEGFANWIQDTHQVDIDGNLLTIAVPDVETKGWLESEYSAEIAAAVGSLRVRYVVTDRAKIYHTLFGRIASMQAEIGAERSDLVVPHEQYDINTVGQILDVLDGADVVAFCDYADARFKKLDRAALLERLPKSAESPGRAVLLGPVMEWATTWVLQQRGKRAEGGIR